MRVFILALDGLEYEYAKEYKVFRQEEFGKVDITGTDTWTPLCWGCFITGLTPQELRPKLIQIPHGERKITALPKNIKTIFDLTTKHVKLFIPVINPHPRFWCKRDIDLSIKALKGDTTLKVKWTEECRGLFMEIYREALKQLTSDWELFMVYFNNPDMYQHVFACSYTRMRYFYDFMANATSEILTRIEHDALKLIISDHGCLCEQGKIPNHSPYAYYSINKELNLKNPALWDFYDIIKRGLADEL